MRILALDLARKTGWALGTVNDKVPESGSVTIASEASWSTSTGFLPPSSSVVGVRKRACSK